jgi:hypothetical protein
MKLTCPFFVVVFVVVLVVNFAVGWVGSVMS